MMDNLRSHQHRSEQQHSFGSRWQQFEQRNGNRWHFNEQRRQWQHLGRGAQCYVEFYQNPIHNAIYDGQSDGCSCFDGEEV